MLANCGVIYLTVVTAYVTDAQMRKIGKEIASLATKYVADEFSLEKDGGSSQWRLWWD
jgi:hypothetical protein